MEDTTRLMRFLTTRKSMCEADDIFMQQTFSLDPSNTDRVVDHVMHILSPSCRCHDDRVAIYLLRHVLRIRPDHSLGWKLLGDMMFARRAYQFLRSLDKDESCEEVRDTGDDSEIWSLSMQMYQRSINFNPDNPGALKGMGDVSLNMLGNPSGAKRWYEAGLKVKEMDDDTRNDLLIGLASAHEHLHEYDEAANLYVRAIDLRPFDHKANNDLAVLLFKQGNLSSAAEIFEALFSNENWSAPYSNAQLCYNYAILLEHLQQPEKALRVLEAALPHHPQDINVRSKLAELLYSCSTEYSRSRDILLENLRIVPNHLPSLLCLSLLEEEVEGSLAEIESVLETALDMEPSNPIFLNLNARAYALWEDYEKCRETISRCHLSFHGEAKSQLLPGIGRCVDKRWSG
uniref:Uncharacterized protein n=1 Tax=Guillardia theta TaxID=55529 RepID=A0A7S4NRG2_GUITH